MLILSENQEDVNVLHIIIGPETDFQFNMSGQSIMDITDYIAKFKEGKRTIVVINQCDCEEALVQELQMKQAQIRAAAILAQHENQENSNNTPQVKKEKTNLDKSNSSGLKCPKCHSPNSAIVKDGEVYPCIVCKKIDDGIKSGVVPPLPTKEELDKIRKETENENPQQKKSRARFFKKPTETKGAEDNVNTEDV